MARDEHLEWRAKLKNLFISLPSIRTKPRGFYHTYVRYQAYLRGLNDNSYDNIIPQVRAVVFLSTPHRGSELANTLDKILSISLTSHTRKAYIQELARTSATIEDLNEDFRHHAKNLQIYSFYELRSTAIKGAQSVCVNLSRMDDWALTNRRP